MSEWVFVLLGLLVGAAAALVAARMARGAARRDEEARYQQMLEQVKGAFAALSREALSANTDDFFKLAHSRFEQQTQQADRTLESKKQLIDARLEDLNAKLKTLDQSIQQIERRRAEFDGALKSELVKAGEATNRLQETAGHLREALASPQQRGQWGERMAEDVLALAGMIEGVNYNKQSSLGSGNRPDFTFLLPGNRKVHMDVKFPLDNYLKMLEASEEGSRAGFQQQFLRDVRARVKEVSTREYIDPGSGTVDYVIVFIPNEQVYGFIHQHDRSLLDDALKNKVVLCSPLTLYAVLAVMRQAVENFRLEQGARQILNLLNDFRKQWQKYGEVVDTMGKRLEAAMGAYNDLVTTRTRQLERQLDRIDDLSLTQEQMSAGALPGMGGGDVGPSGG